MKTWILSVPLISGAALLALIAGVPNAGADPSSVAWQEHFDHAPLGWVDPFDHSAAQLSSVYELHTEGPLHYLHARHDGSAHGAPPAMHFGRAFEHNPTPLSHVQALRWKWRVRHHPGVTDDSWADCAGGVYVIIRTPSFLKGGRGFKFGWLAKPGATGTHQHGLLQVPLRTDPAGAEWRTESVDLCALYKKEYGGSCDGESVLYVGVVTDGDNTHSVAEADYADFELLTSP